MPIPTEMHVGVELEFQVVSHGLTIGYSEIPKFKLVKF